MNIRKKFFNILVYFFIYLIFSAHSPWGQYLAYREQHLLIMSTREDLPTYPYSKILVDVINTKLPEANPHAVIDETFESSSETVDSELAKEPFESNFNQLQIVEAPEAPPAVTEPFSDESFPEEFEEASMEFEEFKGPDLSNLPEEIPSLSSFIFCSSAAGILK